MTIKLKEIEDRVKLLSIPEKALLAERLIESLDSDEESGNELLWSEEAEKRYQAYLKGSQIALAADNVIMDARKQLK